MMPTIDYALRRTRLRQQPETEQTDCILLSSRENNRYYTGFSGTTSLTVLTPEASFILLDSRYSEQGSAECPGTEVLEIRENPLVAFAALAERRHWQTIGIEEQSISLADHQALQGFLPRALLSPLAEAINRPRICKDEAELARIRKAVQIADAALADLLPQIRLGMSENEVAGLLEYLMRRGGAAGASFETIAASGVRSALPHGVAGTRRLSRGDTLVLDFGCIYEGYCSDITRTVFLGEPSVRMREIYEIVSQAQRADRTGLRCLGSGGHRSGRLRRRLRTQPGSRIGSADP
jgi:Xaa-Pro aminopeptidase